VTLTRPTRHLLLILAIASLVCIHAGNAAPALISYQGQLTGSGGLPVPNGVYDVDFALFEDSVGGVALWTESAVVTTSSGLFSHLMGSVIPIPSSTWLDREAVFLELTVDGLPQEPRSHIAAVPFAEVAGNLEIRDDTGLVIGRTLSDDGAGLLLNRASGDTGIVLMGGLSGDGAVVLPEASISASETLDEAGLTLSTNSQSVELMTMEMVDLVTIDIEIPTDGYIVLDGKCYVVLEGTTGPNTAVIQIDEYEGGTTQFPYYTVAGLGGYVNSSKNYFPVHVTRVYYADSGQYTFRMEGRASYAPPAKAVTWDHVLRAVFLPTGYGFTSKVTTDPGDHPHPRLLDVVDPLRPDAGERYYELDMRDLEKKSSSQN